MDSRRSRYVSRVRGGVGRRLPVRACLALAAVLAVALPAQASASYSPVVRGSFCATHVSESSDGMPVAARAATPGVIHSEVLAFCEQLLATGERANTVAESHFSASTRRRIRRVIRSVARRYAPAPVLASADGGRLAARNVLEFPSIDLGAIKDFGKKSLDKLKTTVGGAIKFVPQVRVLRCAVFAALGGAAGYVKSGDMREVLIDSAAACIISVVADFLPDVKKKP